jgi:hypothetical protein
MPAKPFLKILFLFSIVSLAACASKYQIESIKSSSYDGQVKKLFIVADLGKAFPDDTVQAVKTLTTSVFKSCGVAVDYENPDDLTLNNSVNAAYQAFAPDSMLTIQWRSAEANEGVVISIDYRLTLTSEVSGRSEIWKADMHFEPSNDKVPAFVKALVGGLQSKGLVPAACLDTANASSAAS